MKTNKLLILFLFFCTACHLSSKQGAKKNTFQQIDAKLNELARKMGTTVATTDGGTSIEGVPVPADKMEMRRIVWIDGEIGKGILITQNFDNDNIAAPDWDFQNIAWLVGPSSSGKDIPFWQKFLLKKVKFAKIENSIDQLLQQSIQNLQAVKKTDLSYDHTEER